MSAKPWAKVLLCGALLFSLRSVAAGDPAHWEFGFSMATGMNSQLYSCFLVKVFEGKVVESENLTAEQFILQAKGLVKSKANPGDKDLFKEYGIALCNDAEANTVQEQIDACDPFAPIWKLRFQEWPFKDGGATAQENGWAETEKGPSQRQLLLLQEFGLQHAMGLAHGDGAFRLLAGLRDPSWISNYVQGL
ncbi:MAG: hypothetical protein ABI599_09795 [Flavobacteriales bacterium]